MNAPPLAELLRWVSEIPSVFLAEPGSKAEDVHVAAVVSDVFETLFGEPPSGPWLTGFAPRRITKRERNRLRWTLVTTHLLWHPAFRGGALDRLGLELLLTEELATLADNVPVDSIMEEEERREELIRRTLRAAGLEFPGESATEAKDRFRQVDSIERRRVLADAAQRERRAREVRKAMARKAAEEAAAKICRE